MPADPYGAAATCRAVIGSGQERRQVRAGRHRADAGTASAVRDAERLVQVQVRDVRAELARLGQADQRVQVRAVYVHLAADRVHRRRIPRRSSPRTRRWSTGRSP